MRVWRNSPPREARSEAEKKGNDCAGRFKHVRRRWNDPFGTFFSFIFTKVGEKNYKSNRKEDVRKFQ